MKIIITMTVDDALADPDHSIGVTEEGFNAICEALTEVGHDIDVQKAPLP